MVEKWDKIDRIWAGVLAALVGAFFIALAWVRPLGDWDEGLYANIVAEIVKGGHWFHLMLQGVPWFDKEPLGFWLMAGSVKIFGFHVFALRVPALFATVTAVPIFYWLLRKRLERKFAILISLLFWTAPILWFKHTLGTADLEALTLLLGIAIPAALVRWPTRVFPALILLSIFLLTRGIWALPFFGYLAVHELITFWQTKNKRRLLNFMIGTVVAFLPWVAWHALQFNFGRGDYVRIYWQEQFFTRISGEVDGHGGNWHFYWDFLQTQLSLGYATLLLMCSAYLLISARIFKDWLWSGWLLITIIPPHLISTKLEWYLVPALPVLFASLGFSAQTINNKKNSFKIFLLIGSLVLLGFNLYKNFQVYQFFQNKDRQIEQMALAIKPFVPAGTAIVTYGVENWTLGRVLPAMYWHTTLVQGWKIISVDEKSAEYYLANTNEYKYWWVTTSTLQNLQKHDSFSGCSLYSTSDYVFFTVTSSTFCKESL